MVVLHPLKVVIGNLDPSSVIDLDTKKWSDAPADDASSYYKVLFSRIVYIEQSDFRMKDSKDYYGLAPGKTVLLRYAFPIKCTEVVLSDDKKTIVEIHAEYDPFKKTKPKGVLHWVAEPSGGSSFTVNDGNPNQPPVVLSPERVGIVFQFPERYEDAFNMFAEEIDSLAFYQWWEGSFYSILSIIAYPFSWTWLQFAKRKYNDYVSL